MQVSEALKLFRKELPEWYDAAIEKTKVGHEITFVKKTGLCEEGAIGCGAITQLLSRGKLYSLMAEAVAFLERQERKLRAKQAQLKEVA